MEDTSRVEINGYSFEKDMGIEAKKEQRAIEFLTKQLDMDVPNTVLKVYKQIIRQQLFHTPIGYDFLRGLQNYLYTNPDIDNNDIETIKIDSPEEAIIAMNEAKAKRTGGDKKPKVALSMKDIENAGKYKTKAIIYFSTTIILLLAVIAMFVITFTAKVPTVLNYEKVITDRYAEWEQDLTERENSLRGTNE